MFTFRRIEEQFHDVTHALSLGDAVGRLLTLVQNRTGLLLTFGRDSVVAAVKSEWIARYDWETWDDESKRFHTFCRLITAYLLVKHDQARGCDVEPLTFQDLRLAASNLASGRPVPALKDSDYESTGAFIIFAARWLLGREIDLQVSTSDDDHIAAFILSLQLELDSGEPLERSFADCLA